MTATPSADRTVLVSLHDEQLNGATISILRAVPLLRERGWRFAFWVPRPGPAADLLDEWDEPSAGAERPIVSGLQALREPPGVARRLAATPGYMRAFRRFAKEVSPDLVHANSLYSFAEALSSRRAGYPTLLHVHDMAPGSRKAAIARSICRRGVDLTVAVSESCADSYSVERWRPSIVHEAAPIPDRPVETRGEPDPFLVGTVGVISRRKGSDLFVDAAERLAGRGYRFRMIGAATDPLDREWARGVLDRARAAGVEHVERAEVEPHLREFDAFVLPARRDPFPISMLEAMAIGLPVIGTRTDGIAEQIAPGAGLLIAPNDGGALADAIDEVRGMDADRRRAMGAAARTRVVDNFSLEHQAGGLDSAYRQAIETGRRP